jgi:RES domain-containing protein
MSKAYRIVKARYTGNTFDGEGARMQGGRWSSIGTRIVYTAGSLSLAVLEILVHLQQTQILSGYVVFELDFSDSLLQNLDRTLLPADWRSFPSPVSTKRIGDTWIKQSSSAVLNVPSVIVPSEHNFLINPGHSDFVSVKIGNPRPLGVDPRLLERPTSRQRKSKGET